MKIIKAPIIAGITDCAVKHTFAYSIHIQAECYSQTAT
jgi:hypothetical protein